MPMLTACDMAAADEVNAAEIEDEDEDDEAVSEDAKADGGCTDAERDRFDGH